MTPSRPARTGRPPHKSPPTCRGAVVSHVTRHAGRAMGSTSPPHPTVPHSLAPPGSEMAWIRDCPIESPLTVQAREWWLEMADNLVALFHSKHGPKALPVRSSALSVPSR